MAVGSASPAASGFVAPGAASVEFPAAAAAAAAAADEDEVDELELRPSPVVCAVAPGASPTHCDTGLSRREKKAEEARNWKPHPHGGREAEGRVL